MDLPHSGIVANLSFYRRAKPTMEQDCNRKYSKYFDDIIVLYTDRLKFRSFVQLLAYHADNFVIKVTDVSQVSVKYLDLVMSISDRKVQACPYMDKPVAPLRTSSAHADHVHKSWPRSVARRTLLLAAGACKKERFISDLITKYRYYNASDFSLSLMVQVLRKHMHISHDVPSRSGIDAISNNVWIRVGAHPVWVHTLSSIA